MADAGEREGVLAAAGHNEGAARGVFPSADARGVSRVDERLVEPEVTRDEMVEGRRIVAAPSLPQHADPHARLDTLLVTHARPGYVVAADMLTRVSEGSDFATDTSVRREGTDPATGARYLEELSFEVVNEQRAGAMVERARLLVTRGVRRVFGVFVKRGVVCEWDRARDGWRELPGEGVIEDALLVRGLPVRAVLEAGAVSDAVLDALVAKGGAGVERVREQGGVRALRRALYAVCAVRGVEITAEQRARVEACEQEGVLERWIAEVAGGAVGISPA